MNWANESGLTREQLLAKCADHVLPPFLRAIVDGPVQSSPDLRDQFAMAVVQSLTSQAAANPLSYFDGEAAGRVANRAYLIADAMMERRKR